MGMERITAIRQKLRAFFGKKGSERIRDTQATKPPHQTPFTHGNSALYFGSMSGKKPEKSGLNPTAAAEINEILERSEKPQV